MTEEEKAAISWLVKTKHLSRSEINKQQGTPDFSTPIGGFEVKRPDKNNTVTFTHNQLRVFAQDPTITVLLFSGTTFLAEIPGTFILQRLPQYQDFKLHYDESDVIYSVRVSEAIDRELDKIVDGTGRTKSDLIREAITALIGMMRNAG